MPEISGIQFIDMKNQIVVYNLIKIFYLEIEGIFIRSGIPENLYGGFFRFIGQTIRLLTFVPCIS